MPHVPPQPSSSPVPDAVDVAAVAEQLARGSHEGWLRERLAAGWSRGDTIDEPNKRHPALVPYAELPDTERVRLQQMAVASASALASMGHAITAPAGVEAAEDGAGAQAEEAFARQMIDAVTSAPDLAGLLSIWRAQEPDTWARLPDVCSRAGERFIQLGEPLAAYDAVAQALKLDPGHVRLRQVLALALARSGASGQANEVLRQLFGEGHRDEETLGLLARTHKDLSAETMDEADREHHLHESFRYYSMAYELTAGYWTGINAATLATMLGRHEEALALAHEVRERCRAAIDRAEAEGRDLYWPLATMGEAALIIGDLADAEALYRRAADVGRRRFADLHASRRNARLLLQHLPHDATFVEKCFHVPTVVVFAGQTIDGPDAAVSRFPSELEAPVRAALLDRLRSLNAGIGYASAACGSDLLFLDCLLELRGEAHVVLPYGASDFLWDKVETVPGADWGVRFARVLERAAEVVVSSSQKLEGGNVSLEYADRFLYGLARIRAEQIGADFKTVAVWDGIPGEEPAGTIATWQALGHQVEVIDLRDLRRECRDRRGRRGRARAAGP